jgi:hypothetical protein
VWLAKGAVAVAKSRPYALIAKSNDVLKSAVRQLRKKPRMTIDLPSLVMAEAVEERIAKWLAKSAVTVPQGDPHAVFSEAYDVGKTAICEMGKKARMPVDAPILLVAIIGEHELRRLKSAVTVA